MLESLLPRRWLLHQRQLKFPLIHRSAVCEWARSRATATTIETTIDPLIGPTDMIVDIADAALLRSSAMTDRSAGFAVAIRTRARTCRYRSSVTASMAAASRYKARARTAFRSVEHWEKASSKLGEAFRFEA